MLNKTPKANAKKTKWGLKLWLSLVLAVALLLVLGLLLSRKAEAPKTSGGCDGFTINSQCITLERAATNEARIKGLSGEDGLPANSGMVFVFERPDEQCFWMKDMRFAIDMIWLNSRKEVVKIEPGVLPATYPTSFCAPDTQYVIELNSGQAGALGITKGQQLSF